jgi:hypothetical protein
MSETKVITGKVRFSYAHVHEPKAKSEGDDPKYSVSLLIDKSDKATVDKINKAVEAAKEIGKNKHWGGKIPKKLKLPLRDGDEEREDDENYEGVFFVNASSKNKPGIVDANRDEIMDNAEFYSGCYGRAAVNFYPFDQKGNKGVACGLNNLQKLQDGDPLSGGASRAEDDFNDGFGDDADGLM